MYVKNAELSGLVISNQEMFELANRFLSSFKNRDWELLRGYTISGINTCLSDIEGVDSFFHF